MVDPKGTRVPDLDADDSTLIDFKNKYFSKYNICRLAEMQRMSLALHYLYGRQWIELDQTLVQSGSGYAFKSIDGVDPQMPKPVINICLPAVKVENSSLSKRQIIPNILPTAKDPRVETAAKEAKDILLHTLKKNLWPEKRDDHTTNTVATGIGIMRSFWDEPHTETTPTASPFAAKCPNEGCGTMVSNTQVPTDLLMQTAPNAPATEIEGLGLSELEGCPTCEEPTPLQPFELDEEGAKGADFFGRPMGEEVAKGHPALEVVSPFDFYPFNHGVDQSPSDLRVVGQATVRDLDWVYDRYPEEAEDLRPEDPQELLSRHPTMGYGGIFNSYSSSVDSGIYDSHVTIYDIVAEKSYRFPQGRLIRIAGQGPEGGKVLFSGPLYREVAGVEVATVKYAVAVHTPQHRLIWGRSVVDDLVSIQNQVNGIKSQIISARETLGSPNILATENMDLSEPSWFDAYSGKIMRYSIDPLNPLAKPEVFGGVLFPGGGELELDKLLELAKYIAGPQDIEQGEAPRNISTTSGLQLLGEAAERRRAATERALTFCYEKIWSHQLELLWVLRTESDTYEVEGEDGSWEEKQFSRTNILGQTKVTIEKQAEIDRSLYQREAAREAQADMLYIVDNAITRKRLLELRGLPTDVNQDLNYQVDLAKRQWIDYVDDGKIPTIDPSIDDFRIRFQALATMLLSDEGQRLQEEMGWPKTLKQIAGWEQELAKAEMMDDQVRGMYSAIAPPEENNKLYAQAMVSYSAQQEGMEAQGQQMASQGVVGPPPAPLPPPPPPIFLPADKADRVYGVWKQMINVALMKVQQGPPGAPPQGVPEMGTTVPNVGMDPGQGPGLAPLQDPGAPQDAFLKFRSVVEAYKLLAEKKDLMGMMGAPQAPSPGTPGGNPGTGGALPGIAPAAPVNPPNPQPPQIT